MTGVTPVRASDTTELRELVALGCRILGANGHDDYVWGHVSARDPQDRGVWMKASTYGFEEITADHVILVSFDGEVLEGDRPRHSEWPIHTEIMRSRPDAGGVVHSHPPHSIAVGAAGQPLLPLSHAGTLFVPPDVPRFTKTADLIVTPEMGADVAEGLDGESALLLVNHGIVTVGKDVRDAVIRAVLLEKAAHQQVVTSILGEPRHWSSDQEALAKRKSVWSEHHLVMLWDYLGRALPGGPGSERA
ncbi:MAG: class II aldolase/adducin family protein [Actinomycetota bacterium]|nr:class II aldolase/adducin family protein [Actinomycetota bacterium]